MSLVEFLRKGDFHRLLNIGMKTNFIYRQIESGYIVAAAHFRLGNFETACSICEQIEGVFSQNPNFLSMYAAILRRLSLFERAEHKFKEALKIDPTAKDVRNNYTNLLIDQGRLTEAKEILEALVKQDPAYSDHITISNVSKNS